MKALVIGNGGREHAIAWRLAQSPRISTVFVAPGNGGTATDPALTSLPISDLQQLAQFALDEQIALTVVGPEAPWLPVQ
ncbi:phosphoribosylamine--glycine ligase [Advenella kashmirensis WT001]|uniref:Phosphoribosylamine--glycine ligase n=1 Tax=Advenella kashmirensis (strain DSM 17095 / LMG 22695 / WT001) TaxID=1036672 RepID=I3UBD6_ADVKW|nr:phosphoribosylamine--glycine ligase [Advenella kashmirensis WT001]